MSDQPETALRVILGDRCDDVIEKALIAADKGGYYVTRGYIDEDDVSKILAAVLPDLLAEAWSAGWFTGAADIQLRRTPSTPNPYLQDSEGTEAGA